MELVKSKRTVGGDRKDRWGDRKDCGERNNRRII